jgi:hypothetical protein
LRNACEQDRPRRESIGVVRGKKMCLPKVDKVNTFPCDHV